MPIRRSPNGVRHVRPQPGRDRPEWVVAINRNARSQSPGALTVFDNHYFDEHIGPWCGAMQPHRSLPNERQTPHPR